MSEYWYVVDYVGFGRAFVTGRDPKLGEFEIELSESQREKLYDFNHEQETSKNTFLAELVNEA